ncbi:ABC-F family ATP-binding cassette domain-containing protein [Microbacter margulisiae]|uniref:Probable ATP-binding protein YbiT n=1 Tax=Microbacter margulisiae TaxID=1350067 RepID=A0A7W5DTD7_9PORP|nr:ABC-F family ATP-binding cassette domain-containing protein [Microbacter margulisiae]MBB3188400.1 ATP-binding cassette subfamily F protein 3 [Microbacter margulisiae]
MISAEQLTVEFGGFTLFDSISFLVNPKDRIALVGKNGAGKTTLLSIFAGEQNPTSGRIVKSPDITIGYLPQHLLPAGRLTVMEETESAFREILQIQQSIDQLTAQLSQRTDHQSDEYHRLIEQMTHQTEYLHLISEGNYHAEAEKTLTGLGFSRADFDRRVDEFSGGWRMRIELAKILLRKPDLLLLDEPTNHLDIESIQWLENFLTNQSGAVMLVSHDRAFLDNVSNRTIELSLGHIHDFRVSYSKYVTLRREQLEQQQRAYENQQKLIQDTEQFIERFRSKATKAVQVQSRIKQLARLERIELDEIDSSRLNLKFPPAPRSGTLPLEIEHLTKTYDTKVILKDIGLTIRRGEKVAFVGKNGEGKTTLVKCIMGETDHSGLLRLGHNVKIGYFAQNQASLLDENKTVFQTIDDVAVGDIRTKIRDILGAFMFGGEASEKKVKVLSGGERSRLAMIRLLLEPVNLLILDEPTNHLDIPSKDVLKSAIKAFDGTAIIVSHDREFLDGLATKVYEFGQQKVREHLSGIYDFLRHKKMESLQELERTPASTSPTTIKISKPGSDTKQEYSARKEYNRQLKKLERQLEEIESTIDRLEKEITLLEIALNEDNDPSAFEEYQQLQQQLAAEMERWEQLSVDKERFHNGAESDNER